MSTRRPVRDDRKQALAKAIDAIVAKFDGPTLPDPDAAWWKRAERRMRADASRRADALRKAAAALATTRDERGGLRPPSGVGGLWPLSAAFDARYRRSHGGPAKEHLDRLIADLEESAQILESVAPRKQPGRPRDSFLHELVRQVAVACAQHGVEFRDSEQSEAGRILQDVCARVPWAGAHRASGGWRRLLRRGRATQLSLAKGQNQNVDRGSV